MQAAYDWAIQSSPAVELFASDSPTTGTPDVSELSARSLLDRSFGADYDEEFPSPATIAALIDGDPQLAAAAAHTTAQAAHATVMTPTTEQDQCKRTRNQRRKAHKKARRRVEAQLQQEALATARGAVSPATLPSLLALVRAGSESPMLPGGDSDAEIEAGVAAAEVYDADASTEGSPGRDNDEEANSSGSFHVLQIAVARDSGLVADHDEEEPEPEHTHTAALVSAGELAAQQAHLRHVAAASAALPANARQWTPAQLEDFLARNNFAREGATLAAADVGGGAALAFDDQHLAAHGVTDAARAQALASLLARLRRRTEQEEFAGKLAARRAKTETMHFVAEQLQELRGQVQQQQQQQMLSAAGGGWNLVRHSGRTGQLRAAAEAGPASSSSV